MLVRLSDDTWLLSRKTISQDGAAIVSDDVSGPEVGEVGGTEETIYKRQVSIKAAIYKDK